MKFLQIFNKAPKHKQFNYAPRFYDAQAEERKERRQRIEQELTGSKVAEEEITPGHPYGQRIAGSFRQSKKTTTVQADPSASLIRIIILLILSLGLIAYLQFGPVAIYGVAFVFIPFYLYLKFRKFKR